MSIMRKVVGASSAVTALAVGGAIALAVSGGYRPAVADSGLTITASATSLAPAIAQAAPSVTGASPSAPSSAAAPAAPSAGQPAARATTLTEDQAVAIALGQSSGASVREIEPETEHGEPVWKVELVSGGSKIEYRIDAATGAIVRVELAGGDDGADHDDHGADDD